MLDYVFPIDLPKYLFCVIFIAKLFDLTWAAAFAVFVKERLALSKNFQLKFLNFP